MPYSFLQKQDLPTSKRCGLVFFQKPSPFMFTKCYFAIVSITYYFRIVFRIRCEVKIKVCFSPCTYLKYLKYYYINTSLILLYPDNTFETSQMVVCEALSGFEPVLLISLSSL